MTTTLEKIEAFAKAREDKLKNERSDDTLVRLHIAKIMELPDEKLTDADVDYFIVRLGPEYLRTILRGVGDLKANRLYESAKGRAQ